MDRKTTCLLALFLISLPLFATGAGFYVPDRTGYITSGGEEYSWTEPSCASDIYPLNSILTLTDGVTGEQYSVHVTDRIALPPDRDVVLNMAAAEATGINEVGYRSGDITVFYEGKDETVLRDGGWWKFRVATLPSNREAMNTMNVLRENNMKPSLEITENGITVSVRWIPKYQKLTVETTLQAMGFNDVVVEMDENPYL